MAKPKDDDPGFKPDPYRPIRLRRRILIALLAVSTAVVVAWAITRKPGGAQNAHRVDAPTCAPGQTEGCVGGRAQVIVPTAPPSSPASAGR